MISVALELLQAMAANAPQEQGGRAQPTPARERHSDETRFDGDFNLRAYLARYGVEIVKEKPHQGGTLFCLKTCLFNPSHDGNEAAIFQAADGKLSYQCFHDSCKGKTWADARRVISQDDRLAQFCSFQNSRTFGTSGGRLNSGIKHNENRMLDVSDVSDVCNESIFLPGVPGFPIEILPEPYRTGMVEHAQAFSVPVDIPSIALLSIAGACIGRTRGLTIKAGWSEHPNTFTAIVGRSGTGKSPVIRSIQSSIFRLEALWYQNYQTAQGEYEEALEQRKSVKKKDRSRLGPPPPPPRYTQLLLDDSTTEALTDALAQNPRGVLWNRDELSGLILDLDKYTGKDGGTKARLMSSYDCGPWKVSRTGKNKFIDNACLSIFGTIQDKALPVIFSSLDAATGFLPRFNFIRVEQDHPPLWSEKVVSESSRIFISTLLDNLLKYDFKDGDPIYIGVKRDAKDLFIQWFNEQAYEPWNDCDGAIYEAVLAKLRGQCLRFALILHCIEAIALKKSECTPIDASTMDRAITLGNYLKEHQKSVWELCFNAASVIQLQPFERRIAQAIVDLQSEIKGGMLPTSTITQRLNHGRDERFHVNPKAVGKALRGMGLENGHLPDKTGRGVKICPDFLENMKKALGTCPKRPKRPSIGNINENCHNTNVPLTSETSVNSGTSIMEVI